MRRQCVCTYEYVPVCVCAWIENGRVIPQPSHLLRQADKSDVSMDLTCRKRAIRQCIFTGTGWDIEVDSS